MKSPADSHRYLRWGLLLCLAAGLLLRLWMYATHESFWKDETGLARNFLTRDLAHIHEPYRDGQVAPIAFVQLSKLAEMAWGHEEKVFWLLPLLASVALLAVAINLYPKIIPPIAGLLAVLLLALNPILLKYAVQFKPYATDILTTIALMAAFFAYSPESGKRNLWPWVIVGALCLPLSYTSVFVIAGLGLWLLVEAYRSKDKKSLAVALVANLILAAIFVALWFFNFRHLDSDGFFKSFWKDSFAPLTLNPLEWLWYPYTLEDSATFLFGGAAGVLVLLMLVLGLAYAWGAQRRLWALMVPVALTFGASWAGLYPISGRLVLFWLPLLVPFVALGIYSLWTLYAPRHRGMLAVFILFLGIPFFHNLPETLLEGDAQGLRPVAQATAQKAKAGDIIWIHPRAAELYRYYFKRFVPAEGVEVIYGNEEELLTLYGRLRAQHPGKRVFVMVAEPRLRFSEVDFLELQAKSTDNFKSSLTRRNAGVVELSF